MAEQTEADYLKQQTDAAKVAISEVLLEAKKALGEGLDAKEWISRFPVAAIGSAIAAGFVTAVLTIPSKEDQELKKIERVRKALTPEPATPVADGVKSTTESASKHSLWSTLLREGIQILRPILMSLITAGMSGRQGANSAGDGNGQHAEPVDVNQGPPT